MFCEKCGAQLPDDAKFCEKCGSSTVPGAAPSPAAAAAAAAVAPAAPKAPSAFSLALKKFFSNKRNVIIAAAALLLIIAVIVTIVIIASQPKKIYIDDYFHVEFEGVDGTGKAYINVSEKELEALKKIDKKLFGDKADEKSISQYIAITFDMTDEELNSLKNGDKVKIKITINDELYDEVEGYKFVLRHKTVKVKGLYKSAQVNVLDLITPSVTGYSGFGVLNSDEPTVFELINGVEARVSSSYDSMRIEFYASATDSHITTVYAYLNINDYLSNGDKITASINAENYSTDSLYKNFGIILASQTKEYTVSGLEEPIKIVPQNYLTITYDGMSMVAGMQFTVTDEELTAGSYTVAFTKRDSTYSREFQIDIIDENGSSLRTVNYSANMYDNLKNGDTITFRAYADFESIVSRFGISLPESFDIEVSGLEEPFKVDPIERGTYSFAAYNGYAGLIYELPEDKRVYTTDDGKYTIKLTLNDTQWNYQIIVVVADQNGRNFISLDYDYYKSSILSNGDTVTFSCSEWSSTLQDYIRSYGIYFPYEISLTVEGLADTTDVQPLEQATFSFEKKGDYINMTLGLVTDTITVGENTINLSITKYVSYGTEFTRVNATVIGKDGATIGSGYYQFLSSGLIEGSTIYASYHFDDATKITKATGIVFDRNDFIVIVSAM